ncbi:hypothetical protein KVT40_007390 [Elsinoe batatas]|uniref:Transcriptional regulator n=1 Tax=Elsinoe batatas TaxID=2601811 RepID=A0A8K0L1X8_9PEZI|nr:hypothetical protein KVT40_007390 [Elsinoe batatas]
MYLRAAHAETSLPALRDLALRHPLGVLTTAIPHPTHPLIQASHIPFVLDPSPSPDRPDILRGHLARANPQSKTFIHHLLSRAEAGHSAEHLEAEVLVLFTSPVQHYVTPKFYMATKPETGKVVPTWNYAAVQAYGRARIYHDAKSPVTQKFLATQIDDLSKYAEEEIMGFDGKDGNKGAWNVKDAPDKFIELLSKAIVGIEIEVDRLEGKWKMSQELGEGDREGTVKGFEELGTEEGRRMAETVRVKGEEKAAAKA